MTDITTTPDDAKRHAIIIPPELVTICQNDPEEFVRLTRGQLVIVQDRMVQKLLDNQSATVAQYATVHERLSKNAQVEPKDIHAQGGGFHIVLNLGPAPAPPTRAVTTIDVTPAPPAPKPAKKAQP